MKSIIESAYFAKLMLGPGLLRQNKEKRIKLKRSHSENKNVENFLRELLGTHLVQPAIISSARKEITKRN